MNDWLKESELALKAISVSAEMIEDRRPEWFSAQTKGSPRDIVTDLDISIEGKIIEVLKPSNHAILAEESTKGDSITIPADKPVWIIDPIDGTTNFVSAIPLYSISIGLVKGKRFVLGALAMPPLKELYFTMGNNGAYRNGNRLIAHKASLKDSLVVASLSSSSSNPIRRKKEYELFGEVNDQSRGCLRLGSASLNICFAAAGKLKVAYGIDNKIWDIAAAIAVAVHAGCKTYVDWDRASAKASFVVGAIGAADEIAEMITKKKLAKLILTSMDQ